MTWREKVAEYGVRQLRDDLEVHYGISLTRETVRLWVHTESVPDKRHLLAVADLLHITAEEMFDEFRKHRISDKATAPA